MSPPRTPRRAQYRFRMELVVDFDVPVGAARGRETARRLLDSMAVRLVEVELPEEFGEATLRCAELRRLIRLERGGE